MRQQRDAYEKCTDLRVSVDDTLAKVQVRAGRAVVAQLLLRLYDPQQPVDDVVVQRAAAATTAATRGRQLGRRLAVGPQVPGVPRPAMAYTDAGTLHRGRAQQPQHHGQAHRRGRHDDERPAARWCRALLTRRRSERLTRRRHRHRRRGRPPHPTAASSAVVPTLRKRNKKTDRLIIGLEFFFFFCIKGVVGRVACFGPRKRNT